MFLTRTPVAPRSCCGWWQQQQQRQRQWEGSAATAVNYLTFQLAGCGTKQLSKICSPAGDRHRPSLPTFMIPCTQRVAKGTGRMTFVSSSECMMLKPAYTSGGKTQLSFLIPTWRDQLSQRGKALLLFQLGKAASITSNPPGCPAHS